MGCYNRVKLKMVEKGQGLDSDVISSQYQFQMLTLRTFQEYTKKYSMEPDTCSLEKRQLREGNSTVYNF